MILISPELQKIKREKGNRFPREEPLVYTCLSQVQGVLSIFIHEDCKVVWKEGSHTTALPQRIKKRGRKETSWLWKVNRDSMVGQSLAHGDARSQRHCACHQITLWKVLLLKHLSCYWISFQSMLK